MRNILCVALMLISFIAFGQKKNIKEDSIAFCKIVALEDSIIDNMNQGDLSEKNINLQKRLLKNYNDFLLKFPNSDHKFSALAGKASSEFDFKDYSNSRKSYLDVLKFVQENKDLKDQFVRFPSTEDNRFINRLYQNLAEIEIQTKNYQQAIKYLDQAQKNSYRIGCANGLYPEIAHIAASYSECYFNLNDEEKILDILIPITALPMQNEGSPTVTRLYEILLKKYQKKVLKKLFEESFKKLYSKEGVINNYYGTIYYVKFLNRDVILYDSFKNLSEKEIKKKLNKNLQYSKFYTLLIK